MKILVTGGAGFIGSHVVDGYVAAGYDVAVVDNLSSGRREFVAPRARFYQMDIRSPELRSVFEHEHPEVVNHQAAQASVSVSVANPRLDAEINVLGLLNVLSLCAEFGVRRVIFASTGGAIYGEPDQIPVDETHPQKPISPYGISKLAGELYLRSVGGLGLEWAVLRYANVYGPRQDPHGEAGVVAIFTQAMIEQRAPVIFGDGTQTRDFVYVEDVARANLLATNAPGGQIANVATGVETTVHEIFRKLGNVSGFHGTARYGAPRAGDVHRIALSAERAKAWLGWTPQVTLDDGLGRTVAWFRSRAPGTPTPFDA